MEGVSGILEFSRLSPEAVVDKIKQGISRCADSGLLMEVTKRKQEAFEAANLDAMNNIIAFNVPELAERFKEPIWEWDFAVSKAEDFTRLLPLIDVHPLNRAGVMFAWSFALRAIPCFVEATEPRHASIDGVGLEHSSHSAHSYSRTAEGLPKFFRPWNYLGPDLLTAELRAQLAELPAHRSEPFGPGWLLQVVEHPYERPSKEFIEALRRLPGDLKYKQVKPPRR